MAYRNESECSSIYQPSLNNLGRTQSRESKRVPSKDYQNQLDQSIPNISTKLKQIIQGGSSKNSPALSPKEEKKSIPSNSQI